MDLKSESSQYGSGWMDARGNSIFSACLRNTVDWDPRYYLPTSSHLLVPSGSCGVNLVRQKNSDKDRFLRNTPTTLMTKVGRSVSRWIVVGYFEWIIDGTLRKLHLILFSRRRRSPLNNCCVSWSSRRKRRLCFFCAATFTLWILNFYRDHAPQIIIWSLSTRAKNCYSNSCVGKSVNWICNKNLHCLNLFIHW